MMRFDHRFHYDLTTEKIDQLIAEGRSPSPLRVEGKGKVPKPVRPPAKKARAPRKKKAADA
jgi:hypothetical protein